MSETEFQDLLDTRDHAGRCAGWRPARRRSPRRRWTYLAARTPLVFWRQRAGLTQKALADKVGVSQAYLAQLEASEREGGVKVWAQLAEALGVRIDDLVNEALWLPEKLVEQEQDRRLSAHKP